MVKRKAFGRLKAVLLIDILVAALAAGTYLYLTSQGVLTQGPNPHFAAFASGLFNGVALG